VRAVRRLPVVSIFATRRAFTLAVLFAAIVSFVLNSTLSFLLVFRLNRAASRFWTAREFWGKIVAQTRSYVGGIIVHGDHDREARDESIRWVAAFSVATMEFLRGEKELRLENYAGILLEREVKELHAQIHPPMFAADKARYHLKQVFNVKNASEAHYAFAWSQEMNSLENQLNSMVWCGGGLERIKATPLPIVYVSHLRTFLLINLILFPWVFGPSWGWMTIPIVAASAFAWLGIDSAAVEVECPFRRDRVNALNMDAYVIGLLATLEQQIRNHADQVIERVTSREGLDLASSRSITC
jgi:ion channel-forming bestrophin family protein